MLQVQPALEQLSLNPGKTEVLVFTPDGFSKEVSYLVFSPSPKKHHKNNVLAPRDDFMCISALLSPAWVGPHQLYFHWLPVKFWIHLEISINSTKSPASLASFVYSRAAETAYSSSWDFQLSDQGFVTVLYLKPQVATLLCHSLMLQLCGEDSGDGTNSKLSLNAGNSQEKQKVQNIGRPASPNTRNLVKYRISWCTAMKDDTTKDKRRLRLHIYTG